MDLLLDLELYRKMRRIRRAEETVAKIYPSDKIKSPVHLSIGQEAVSVGVCSALTDEDGLFTSYRCHAPYLAKGGSLKRMLAELFGKVTGSGQGKAGSMHLNDPDVGMFISSAIVGTNVPLAVGYALSRKLKGLPGISVAFFGDGAVDEGAVHESLLLARMKRLPVLFVCENNQYAIHSHHVTRHGSPTFIAEWASGYGIRTIAFEDDDVVNLHDRTRTIREDILRGDGPVFFECPTLRWLEHVGPGEDFGLGYRESRTYEEARQQDQLTILGKKLTISERTRIDTEIEAEIEDAVAYAEQSPFPDARYLFSDRLQGDPHHAHP